MRIVIALGGNALGNTPEEQLKLVKKTAKIIVQIIKDNNDVVISHGNGPQVGAINLAMEYSANNNVGTPIMPFAECGSMSQGYIGYHLQQSITNELEKERINKKCVTLITEVEVDKNDKAFSNPTKPVGMFYNKKEADKLQKEKEWTFVEDSGRGYRRVVASPKPKAIVELDTIKNLVEKGNTVICCGGGGVPVIKKNNSYVGIDAVIDKDFSSCLLAKALDADILLILTAVDKVSINFNKKDEKQIDILTLVEAKKYIKENQFGKGSMLPKIEASVNFVEDKPDKKAIITSLLKASIALKGDDGTKIINNKESVMEKKRKNTNKKKFSLSAFSIILVLLFLVAAVTWFIPDVTSAKLSDILMAPVKGFADAADVCIFIIILGGFLAIVQKTGALESGIATLVRKLKGKELWLIPILMFIFSIGGTTYGMLEETVGFYILLAATMVAAGYDTIVGSAIVLLGAGSGVLGSTINPFAVGAAVSALPENIQANQGVILFIGVILWLTTYLISTLFVLKYAEKVKNDKGSTFLSLQEQKAMQKKFVEKEYDNDNKLTTRQKVILVLFGLTFLIMILGFIPWVDFGIISEEVAEAGTHWTAFLTGTCFGWFYFHDAATLFLIMAIVIGVVGKLKEKEIVDTFIKGCGDIIGVVLIVALARGISVIMNTTGLGSYIITHAVNALQGTSGAVFAPIDYLLHVGLSFLIPSSSGIATMSTPIVAPVAAGIGLNPSVSIMILVAANGLVNLITPTCGAIMGGLALAKVEFTTWVKFAWKIVLTIALANIFILTIAMVIL